MKLDDYISQQILRFPSLYKDVDYEKSKHKVLCQAFFTIGNGLELAETEIPSEGGYIVEPKYKKSEPDRIKDKPYGAVKHKKLPSNYFETDVYYVYNGSRPLDVNYFKNSYGDSVYFRYQRVEKREFDFNEPKLYKAESFHEFSPYPISKNYSIASEIYENELFLQDDWMEALIELCERTLIYFNDPEQYSKNVYYPTEVKINNDLKYFKERFDADGLKGLIDLRKIWGYEKKETLPDYAEIEARKNKAWEKFHKEQLIILKNIIKKYKK